MATFPSITPSARMYSPGDVPMSYQTSMDGSGTGFRRGNRRVSQTLNLSYQNMTETQVTEFRTHYDTQKGSFDTFFLSEETWAGYGTPPVPLVSDHAWLYSSPPTIADGFTSRWNVEIELRTVPIDVVTDLIIDGQDASDTWAYTLDAGSASTTNQDYIIDSTGA